MLEKHKIIVLCTFLAVIFVIIFKVSVFFQKLDPHMFESIDCKQSCWMGLTAGEDTKQQVDAFIGRVGSQWSIKQNGSSYLYNGTYDSIDIYMTLDENLLTQIDIRGNFDLTLENTVQILGEPEYIQLAYGVYGDGQLGATLILYYLGDGYTFYFPQENRKLSNNNVEICTTKQSATDEIHIYPLGESIEAISTGQISIRRYFRGKYPVLETDLKFSCRQVEIP